jgi:peptidoglycan/xylan/chitin deacetylase (PgdA/CDA1 family)
MYHGVTSESLPVFNGCQLGVSEFEKQIDFLANQYNVIALDEFLDRSRRDLPLPNSAVCLTFDDGYRNLARTAFPILEKRQMPSTVFLVTGATGSGQPAWPERLFCSLLEYDRDSIELDGVAFPLATPEQRASSYASIAEPMKGLEDDERRRQLDKLAALIGWPEVPADSPFAPLDWNEVDRWARTGLVRFGSHTHSHPILARCSPEVQERELRVSHDILDERGCSSGLLAYPNGTRTDFSPVTKDLLKEVGYDCGLSSIHGLNAIDQDRFEFRRIRVGPSSTLSRFELSMVLP